MSSSRDERLARWAPWVLLLLTAAAYAGVPHLGFVWDDIPLVRDNLVTGDLEALRGVLQLDLWATAGGVEQNSGYYRPLILLVLALDRALWGLSPGGHHLHSLGWHVLAAGLLYRLLASLVRPIPALAGAALFALHPVQSESVIWIAARNDSMAATFVFASCLVLLPRGASLSRCLAGLALVLGGMLSKETAILAPMLLLGLDLARGGPLRDGWRRHLAAWGAVAGWLALRSSSGVGSAGLPGAGELRWLASLSPQLVGHYAARIVWPSPLSVGHTAEYLLWDPALHLGAIALVLGLVGLLAARGGRLAWVGLAFGALALVPTVLAIAMRGQLGERYLYLPIGGLALALASAWPDRRHSLGALVPASLLSLLLIHQRVPEWQSDVSLWRSAYRDVPDPYTAVSLGHALNSVGQHEEATLLFHEGLRHERPYLYACQVSVATPLKNGRPELAATGADLGVEADCPEDDRLRGLRAVAWLLEGRVEDARGQVQQSSSTEDPRLPLAEGAIALIDGNPGRVAELDAQLGHPEGFQDQVFRLASRSGRLSP